jgi:hypothetical protein
MRFILIASFILFTFVGCGGSNSNNPKFYTITTPTRTYYGCTKVHLYQSTNKITFTYENKKHTIYGQIEAVEE